MEEIQMERWQLAVERIRQIAEDPEVDGGAGDYFKRTAEFVLLMLEALEKAENGWMETASLEELQAWNDRLYGDIAGKAYESSYANPAWAVSRLPDASLVGMGLATPLTTVYGIIFFIICFILSATARTDPTAALFSSYCKILFPPNHDTCTKNHDKGMRESNVAISFIQQDRS